MITGPDAGEHDSDAQTVAAKESHTPEVTDTKPDDAGSERSLDPKKSGRLKRLRVWLSDPPWWVPNVLVALFISLVVFAVQWKAEDDRDTANKSFQEFLATQAQQDQRAQAQLAQQNQRAQAQLAQRLENLRFVREHAVNGAGNRPPFAELDLQDQNLSHLAVPRANFSKANLSGANLEETILDGADLQGAILKGAHLMNVRLDGANLADADLTGADLTFANLSGAVLSGAHLTETKFDLANLTNVSFSGGQFEEVPGIIRYYAAPATLSNTDLQGADLGGANLADVDLTGIFLGAEALTPDKLVGIYYDESTTKWPNGFRPPPSRPKPPE